MSQKFETSLNSGIHNQMLKFEGNFNGITKVWFEPETLADTSSCKGKFTSILGGRFLLHEYQGALEGKPIEGVAIFGYSIGDEKLQCAWVDSFHNGTAIMFSENSSTNTPYSVTGYYGKEPRWGWKTNLELISENKIIITMFNISPDGIEVKAVETIYERVK